MEAVVKPVVKTLFKIRPVRILLLLFGGLLFGYLGVDNLTEEVRYSFEGHEATAQVEQVPAGRRGSSHVELAYEVDGQPVKATMVTWLFRPQPGEQVRILYRPDKPHIVHLDSFWRRFLLPMASLLLATGAFGLALHELWGVFCRRRSDPPGATQAIETAPGPSPAANGAKPGG